MNAALAGLQRMFPQWTFVAEPLDVPSGMADQPMTDEENLTSASCPRCIPFRRHGGDREKK